MRVLIINGPNLNLLGERETDIYGEMTFEDYLDVLQHKFPHHEIGYYQSNIEGELINKLHEATLEYNVIIMNAGGYTHTSVALADAIEAIDTPVIEVHISNILAREEYRHISLMAAHCIGTITGFGLDSYRLALEYLKSS